VTERLKRKALRLEATLGKQTYRVQTWHVGTDCFVLATAIGEGPITDGRCAVYDGHSATVMKQIDCVSRPRNRPCTRTHRRDTMVLSRANTCTREQQAWAESHSVLSASAVSWGV